MKKIIKFLIEMIITLAVGYGLLYLIGTLMTLAERLPLEIVIGGLFAMMIAFLIIEYKGEI